MSFSVTIGGVAACVSAPGGTAQLSIQRVLNGRDTAQLKLLDLDRAEWPDMLPQGFLFKPVVCMLGTKKVFSGYVTQQSNSGPWEGLDHLEITLSCVGNAGYLDIRTARKIFEPGEFATTIVGALLADPSPGGDTAADDGITSANVNGSLQIARRIIIDGATLADSLTFVCDDIGAHWFVDFDGDVNLKRIGGAAPFAIDEDSATCKARQITTSGSTERYRNSNYAARDISQMPPYVQVFEGDGSNRDWFVDFELGRVTPVVIRRKAKYAQSSVVITSGPAVGATVTVDTTVYTFHTTLSAANDVLIGDTPNDSARNLSYAINGAGSWAGILFHASTVAHGLCEAAYNGGNEVIVRVREIGTGEGTTLAASGTGIGVSSGTMLGAFAGESNEMRVGVVGEIGADFYWLEGTTAIQQGADVETLAADELLEVRYRKIFSNWLHDQDSSAISALATATGTSGRWDAVAEEQASDGAATLKVIDALIRKFGVIPTRCSYQIDSQDEPLALDLVPGMAQTFKAHGFDGTALITDLNRSFFYGAGEWRARTDVVLIGYPSGSVNEPWERWGDLILPGSVGSISGGSVAPGGSAPAPDVQPPGPIGTISSVVVDYSDPVKAWITAEAVLPTTLNDFDGCEAFLFVGTDGPIAVGHIAHEVGAAGPFQITIELPRPNADETWTIYLVSRNARVSAKLITDVGPTETPNFDVAITARPADTAFPDPELPLGTAVAVLDRGENYALQITVTPPSPLGGTAGYEREVRYWNDAGLTVPDSDWIELGFVDTTSTISISGPWPRPGYNQWVKVRVRSINWDGVKTAWVESSTAAALTPLALPPAIGSNDSTVELIDDGEVSEYYFHLALTPAASLGTTTWYEAYVKYYNNSGLTVEDHPDWIYLGGIDPATNGHDTSRWQRREIDQWAVIRIFAKNAGNKLGPSVNSATLVIPKRPAAATSGATMYVTSATAARVSPVSYSADGVEQTEIDLDWIQPTNTDARTIIVTVTNPADAGDTDRETHRERIGDWANHGAARSLRIGPWPTRTETTRIKIWTVNRDDVQLGSPVTVDVAITAQAFLQATSFMGGTEDYDAKRGAVVKPITLTGPVDPRLTGFVLFQQRGTDPAEEIGFVDCASGATVNHQVTVELPTSGTESITLYATPRRIGSTAAISGGTASITFSVDSNSQAPASSYEGFDRYVLASNPTLSKTPAAGKSYIVILEQNGTGGFAPTWNVAHFRNAAKIPDPWPDANSTTVYNFQGDDFGAGVLWQFTGAAFDV